MKITQGDFVRPSNSFFGLPLDSVWRVVSADGSLKLEPENDAARNASGGWLGHRYPNYNFDKVVRCRGQRVDARDAELRFGPASVFDDAVATSTIAAEQAASATAAIGSLLEDARKLEAERQDELRIAKAAKAKADKEAAARAQREEAREALAAKLYADRCLAEATLELIAEVSRMNNGGSEQLAHPSIAAHCDQLQPLAKSYGYRIAKPSMLAHVIKL